MERSGNNDTGNDKSPKVPDDISELDSDIRSRYKERKKAFDMMLERASAASSEIERDEWMIQAEEMREILDEFKLLYPETTRESDEDNS
jgi:hypothetical protein